jgi:mevalonate kinase
MITATAPGKIILFGEHAVVYGQPALAVPVHDIRAKVCVQHGEPGSGLIIEAADLNLRLPLIKAEASQALAVTVRLVLEKFQVSEPDAIINIQSTIPIAAGLGSGAAVSAAITQGLATYLGQPVTKAELSALVYEVEKLHHGTPSGIDNTVVCYEQPVYFIKGNTPEPFHTQQPFHLLIGDTGVASLTKIAVGDVRKGWERDPQGYEATFDAIGKIARQARQAIESGSIGALGPLMGENQACLRQLEVSSPELEQLIDAAMQAGAEGAKLSGGGRGGNMIALVAPSQIEQVREALLKAGAVNVIHTVVR